MQLASDAIETIYANAAEDGLGAFVMFWNNAAADLQYLSLEEFEEQKSAFQEIGVVQEGSIIKRLNGGFVEYILFNKRSERPHHVALALTATVIKRDLLYVVCFPVESLSPEKAMDLETKFNQQETILADAQAEVSQELKGVDIVFFAD